MKRVLALESFWGTGARRMFGAAVSARLAGAACAAWFLVGSAFAQNFASRPSLTDGLIAWYAFDGDFSDSQGRLADAAAMGAPVLGPDRFGRLNGAYTGSAGGALSLDGVLLANHSFSVQFWTFNPRGWFLGQGVRRDFHGLHIGVEAGRLRCDYWSADLSAPLAPGDGWTHWVLVHDVESREKSIWRDGVRVAFTLAPAYEGAGLFVIGRHFLGGGYYEGGLDDVAFWNRALGSDEIVALHAGVRCPAPASQAGAMRAGPPLRRHHKRAF